VGADMGMGADQAWHDDLAACVDNAIGRAGIFAADIGNPAVGYGDLAVLQIAVAAAVEDDAGAAAKSG